jgi:hypothetical protein
VYPGAIIPSDTSREMMRAVARSHGAERAIKSPKEDIRSAPDQLGLSELYKVMTANVPRALAYAEASGVKGSLR